MGKLLQDILDPAPAVKKVVQKIVIAGPENPDHVVFRKRIQLE